MDSEEITFIICSIDKLTNENRMLRARLEAVEQNSYASSNCHSSPERNVITNGLARKGEDDADADAVESLTTKRLDEIVQGASASKSTWAGLRQVYPPRQSGFAPRHSSAGIPASKMSDSEADDEAYSQAATMAAYGMELLRIALSTPQINRRLTRQTSRLLATLCATLVVTRDQHRDKADKAAKAAKADKAAGEIANGSKLSRDAGADSESANIYLAKRSRSMEHSRHSRKAPHSDSIRQQVSPTLLCASSRKHSDCGYESSSELTDLSSEFSCQEKRRHYKHAKRSEQGTSANTAIVATPISPITPASELQRTDDAMAEKDTSDGDYDASASDAEINGESDLVLGQGQVMRLHRRVVVRNALLSRGLPELAATAFFDRWSTGTNKAYDGAWTIWVVWCEKQGLDPLTRCETHLATCISEVTKSASSATRVRIVARSIWSVADGTVQVADVGK